MKSPAFSYYQAKDLADAINIKKSDDDAVILAGGQSLLPTLNMRLSSPSVLIDIGSINELKKIKVEDSYLIMGAMCSHSQIMNNKEVNEKFPLLNKLLAQVSGQSCFLIRPSIVLQWLHNTPRILPVSWSWSIKAILGLLPPPFRCSTSVPQI